MNLEMTFTLFKEFLEEGMTVLKIKREDWPEIKVVQQYVDLFNPILIDWDKKIFYVDIQSIKDLIDGLSHGGYCPTILRSMAYRYASLWARSMKTGKVDEVSRYDDITSMAISTIKGLQLFMDYPSRVIFPEVQNRIKKLTGLNTGLRTARTVKGETREIVYIKCDGAANQYLSLVEELIDAESSEKKPLGIIKEGDLGSRSNPFGNVKEAAAYIQKLESKRLANDKFRAFINDTPFFYDVPQNIFRIPWASPFVAYLDGPGVIKNGFVVNQLASRRFNFKPSLVNKKFLFRGQAEFFEPCVPNMFRNHKENYFAKYNVFSCEMELLLDTHPMVKLFKSGIELFHDQFVLEVNYGGLSQHYYNKTQFLDLTSDIEAAKFFAVTTFDMDSNTYVPFTKDGVGVMYYYDLEPDAFMVSRYQTHKYILSAIGKQPFMRSGAQHGYLLAMEKDVDFNTIPQVRYVFFKHDRAITEEIFQKSEMGRKYMRDDILQHHWYDKMMDPIRKRTISYEAFLKNWSYNKPTSKRKILKALREAEILISRDYVPLFSKDELRKYYYDYILEKWYDFCEDIYFYGSEGRILKEYLLNIPKDPKYHKYFYE